MSAEMMTPPGTRAIRAIAGGGRIVLPVSALIGIALAVATYLRDNAVDRIAKVESAAVNNTQRINDHEGRIIRSETQAEAARESQRRIEAALETMNQKLDRLAERGH